jgi:hypothetical protein
MYGDNVILTCQTGHVLTDRAECPVRQWYGGHKDKLLLYNKVSLDATKYEDRTNLSSTEFSLVIKNYTESDLNINYTCSCGFKSYMKLLGLNDEDFIGKYSDKCLGLNDKDFIGRYIVLLIRFDFLIFGVLTPLSTIFQLYHGDQF